MEQSVAPECLLQVKSSSGLMDRPKTFRDINDSESSSLFSSVLGLRNELAKFQLLQRDMSCTEM